MESDEWDVKALQLLGKYKTWEIPIGFLSGVAKDPTKADRSIIVYYMVYYNFTCK